MFCFSTKEKCALRRRVMDVETLSALSEMNNFAVLSQCYCLVFLGIIYLTHVVQTQTVMLISLMNMFK